VDNISRCTFAACLLLGSPLLRAAPLSCQAERAAALDVSVFLPEGRFSILTLTNLCGSVSVDTLGARVVSYVPAGGKEVLASLADGSGGVALCWPWFANDGPEGCRRHGVARYHEFAEVSRSESPRASELRLRLLSNAATRREFPYDFSLTLVIRLEKQLTLRLIGENTGKESFSVTEMFHPYFRVGDARRCVVRGLDGLTFRDNVHPELGDDRVWRGDYAVEDGSKVFAFANPKGLHTFELEDPIFDRALVFTSSNDLKTVVWSPGEASARGRNVTSHLAPGEWKTFVCVENGTCYGDHAYVLMPGERHELVRTIGVFDRFLGRFFNTGKPIHAVLCRTCQ